MIQQRTAQARLGTNHPCVSVPSHTKHLSRSWAGFRAIAAGTWCMKATWRLPKGCENRERFRLLCSVVLVDVRPVHAQCRQACCQAACCATQCTLSCRQSVRQRSKPANAIQGLAPAQALHAARTAERWASRRSHPFHASLSCHVLEFDVLEFEPLYMEVPFWRKILTTFKHFIALQILRIWSSGHFAKR